MGRINIGGGAALPFIEEDRVITGDAVDKFDVLYLDGDNVTRDETGIANSMKFEPVTSTEWYIPTLSGSTLAHIRAHQVNENKCLHALVKSAGDLSIASSDIDTSLMRPRNTYNVSTTSTTATYVPMITHVSDDRWVAITTDTSQNIRYCSGTYSLADDTVTILTDITDTTLTAEYGCSIIGLGNNTGIILHTTSSSTTLNGTMFSIDPITGVMTRKSNITIGTITNIGGSTQYFSNGFAEGGYIYAAFSSLGNTTTIASILYDYDANTASIAGTDSFPSDPDNGTPMVITRPMNGQKRFLIGMTTGSTTYAVSCTYSGATVTYVANKSDSDNYGMSSMLTDNTVIVQVYNSTSDDLFVTIYELNDDGTFGTTLFSKTAIDTNTTFAHDTIHFPFTEYGISLIQYGSKQITVYCIPKKPYALAKKAGIATETIPVYVLE